MEGMPGFLKVRVVRGINLACRDSRGADPYVVVSMGDQEYFRLASTREGDGSCPSDPFGRSLTSLLESGIVSNHDRHYRLPIVLPCYSSMGLLKVRVVRGVNLAYRDTRGGDPYVVVSMGEQKVNTSVKKNCLNPEWNDDLTISVMNPSLPVRVEVFDKDTFSRDDKMGNAEIDLQPIVEAARMDKVGIANEAVLKMVQPSRENCLARESCVVYKDGYLVQDMILRLANVECGEVELRLEWVTLPEITTI